MMVSKWRQFSLVGNYPFNHKCIMHVQLDQYGKQQISESISSDSKDRRDRQADGKSFCAVSNTV